MERLPDVELHIAGFGQLESFFTKLSQETDNVYFYGRIPYNQALQLEAECDIMTAIYDPSNENCRRAAPNKFYESLMLGKPVVMVKGTGMSDLVDQHNIGTLIDFSEEGFENGIHELIRRREEWPDISARMKCIYRDNYSWDVMNKRLIELYLQLSV
jgi:glycosyltransferase involved in cell wall biosynthesis